MLGTLHLAFAVACLVIGGVVLTRPKGGRRHRVLGYAYAALLLVVNLSALSVYRDSAGLGPFHVLAVVSLATLAAGIGPTLASARPNRFRELHAYCMCWSYVGLVAAGTAQLTAMWVPGWAPAAVVSSSAVVVVVGGSLIHSRVPSILASERIPFRRS